MLKEKLIITLYCNVDVNFVQVVENLNMVLFHIDTGDQKNSLHIHIHLDLYKFHYFDIVANKWLKKKNLIKFKITMKYFCSFILFNIN